MWKSCGKLNRWLATSCCAASVRKFCPNFCGERRKQCWNFRGAACVFLVLGIWGDFKYFVNVLIHGFGCGSNLGYVEGCSLGGDVGADWSVFTLGGYETGSTLGYGTGMLQIFLSWRFSLWVCGRIGGKGKICKRGWDVLLCKMWAIWLITFSVSSP